MAEVLARMVAATIEVGQSQSHRLAAGGERQSEAALMRYWLFWMS